jgi:gliding motility-associated-like protein
VVGDYTLEYSFAAPCPDKHTMLIHVVTQFDASISILPSQATVCQNAPSFAITKVSNGGKFFATCGACINQTTGVFNPSLGRMVKPDTISYGLQSNCGDTASVYIQVLPVFTSVITQDKSICPNQTYTPTNTWLPVDPATLGYVVPGTWKFVGPGAGLNAATGKFDAAQNATGSYKITYDVNTYACYVPDTITITVVAPPTATITGDSTICENVAGVQLSATGFAGAWWEGQGKVNSTGFFSAAGAAVGIYPIEYRMDNGTCKDTVDYNVRVKKVPKTDFVGAPLIGCVILSVTLNDLSDSLPVISLWTFYSGITQGEIGTTSRIYNNPGKYQVTLMNTYANGCISVEQKLDYITALEWPKADFGSTPEIMNTSNPTATFYDASSASVVGWSWDFGPKGKPSTSILPVQDVTFSSTDDDTIPVKLVVDNGYCKDSIIKNVIVRSNTTIFVPNAFTPNNDGDNDEFIPMGINFNDPGYEFMVFDRWGEVIFKTNNATEGWKGKRNNNMRDAQEDVYIWRVTYVDHFSGIKQKPIVGHVALIR